MQVNFKGFCYISFIFLLVFLNPVIADDAQCKEWCDDCYGRTGSGGWCDGLLQGFCAGSDTCHPSEVSGVCQGVLSYCCCKISSCGACICSGGGKSKSGKCSYNCFADQICDGQDPNSGLISGSRCIACNSECKGQAYDAKPCPTATCTASGWSSCSSTPPIPPPPPTPPYTPPSPSCPSGDWRCSGYYREVCNGQRYVRETQPSLQCCTDGDCGSYNCVDNGGAWKSQAPNMDIPPTNNYCCGDDTSDFGKRSGYYLCVKDGETNKWVKGEEDKTSLDGSLLFCNSNFYFCIDNLGNSGAGATTAAACRNECHYFCDVNNKTWADRRQAYPKFLYERLGDPNTDKIDKLKNNMAGKSGCCPNGWCYDGSKCVEDQSDEACDPYLYNKDTKKYRCIAGDWKEVNPSYNFKNDEFGFCPKITDCYVGCGNSSNNFKPETAYTSSPPECINSTQFISDHFCYNGNWTTRTALIATKMANTMDGDFIIACDSYNDILNEYDYIIDQKAAERFLASYCKIDGANVPCANNFCVAKNIGSGQIIFGTSLNGYPGSPLSSANNMFGKVIGNPDCRGSQGNDQVWSYVACQKNISYNPFLQAILYSDMQLSLVDDMDGWDAFNYFLKRPIKAIISLIRTGSISYIDYINETERKFPVLSHAPAFGKFFLFSKGGMHIEGVLEKEKHDPATGITQNYMIINYSNTPDVCTAISNFTKFLNMSTCVKSGNSYIVTDSSNSLHYLLQYWLDLTTKLKI